MKCLMVLALLVFSVPEASAAVYRCERDGKLTFTDQPCHAGAEPAQLPAVTGIAAERHSPDLAKQYDTDTQRQTDSQAKADRAWLKQHADDKQRADDVRKGLIEGRVVRGMTPSDVRRVLSDPQSIEGEGGPKERWTYQNGRERRTIAFKDGVVSSDTVRSARK